MNLHTSFNLEYHGIQIQQHWKPFLGLVDQSDDPLIRELELMKSERADPPSINEQKGAAFAVLGTGASYARPDQKHVKQLDQFAATVSTVSDIVGPQRNFWTDLMDPVDGIGNQLFFAPPAGPFSDDMLAKEQVIKMQEWLHEAEDDVNFPVMWAYPELVAGQNLTWSKADKTGFEVIKAVSEAKANILLNVRCNAKLNHLKGPPYDRTCCNDYNGKSGVQLAVVGLGIVYLTLCLMCEVFDLMTHGPPRWPLFNMEIGGFVMALLLCHFADRTQMFAKGHRAWMSYTDLAIACAPLVIFAIVTLRKSQPPRSKPGVLVTSTDQPFLSRDQTDEWKGWMQGSILIYHWTKSVHEVKLFAFIRLVVAAYLFQTGYNHTTYFLTKKDYSFKRVAGVMLRLNLLTCTLAYIMNTTYLYYYFAPLCSFWFMIVYITLAIGHKTWNDKVYLVIAKILLSSIIVPMLLLWTPLRTFIFGILQFFFKIRWTASGWEHRSTENLFIVQIGMLAAVANMHTKKPLGRVLRFALGLLGALAMGLFWCLATDLFTTTDDYLSWHPYVSFIPILSFIAMRNISTLTRNYSSRAMIWLGQCSLESYILQGHLFLAGDYSGVLLIDGLSGGGPLMGRWRSLLIIVPVFLWISSLTASATGKIVNLVLSTPAPPSQPTPSPSPPSSRPPPQGPSSQYLLSRIDEKDEEDDDTEVYINTSRPSRATRWKFIFATYLRKIPGVKLLTDSLQARVILILLIFWALNLLSPWPGSQKPTTGRAAQKPNPNRWGSETAQR